MPYLSEVTGFKLYVNPRQREEFTRINVLMLNRGQYICVAHNDIRVITQSKNDPEIWYDFSRQYY